MHSCPYCAADRRTVGGLYDHVLTEHRQAVLSYWVDEHDLEPPRSGQQLLTRGAWA